MKVLKKSDFLQMPAGTIFSIGEQWAFEGFYFKGESWMESGDFLFIDMTDIGADSSEQRVAYLQDSLNNGSSCWINHDVSRDGMHNDDDLFLVYEERDLQILHGWIIAALQTIKMRKVIG